MSIETYTGKAPEVYPQTNFPGLQLPMLPKPVCGVHGDNEAPEELKGPLILFSSGLDSTYLVHEALKTSNVHLLYVIGNFNKQKAKLELEAREKIKKYFSDNPHSEYRIISDTILQFEIGDVEQSFNAVRLTQPAMWLFPAMNYYKSGLHTSVQIAYVKGDIIQPHLEDLKTAWDCLTRTAKFKQIPLEFPIRDVDKTDSYNALSPELRSLIWVCDMPLIDGNRKSIECKSCGPCKRRALYLNQTSEGQA